MAAAGVAIVIAAAIVAGRGLIQRTASSSRHGSAVAQVLALLHDPAVGELDLAPNGSVFIRRAGGRWERLRRLNLRDRRALVDRVVREAGGTRLDGAHPTFQGVLPGTSALVTAAIRPASPDGPTLGVSRDVLAPAKRGLPR